MKTVHQMSRFWGWKCVHTQFSECLHVTALPGVDPEAPGKNILSTGSADFKVSEGRRLLLPCGQLLFTALGCFQQLMNGERVFQNLSPLHVILQKSHLPLAFQHNSAASLITHQISNLANFMSCWPAASGITAHLVKNKLCCCSSVKDRTSGSSSQANQTLSRWCILHLHHHCSLFLLLLPKTSETSLLRGETESMIYKLGVTVQFVLISRFSKASSCDKRERHMILGK